MPAEVLGKLSPESDKSFLTPYGELGPLDQADVDRAVSERLSGLVVELQQARVSGKVAGEYLVRVDDGRLTAGPYSIVL